MTVNFTSKKLAYIGVGLLMIELALLFSGYRFLVWQSRSEEWIEGGGIILAEKIGDTLACSYFTGRSIQTMTFGAHDWKPDECPFLFKPKYLN